MNNYEKTVNPTENTTRVTKNFPGATANEISIDCRGLNFLTIYGTHINGGYVAFPGYGVSAELCVEDDFYNDFRIFCALKSSSSSELLKHEALPDIARELSMIISPLLYLSVSGGSHEVL